MRNAAFMLRKHFGRTTTLLKAGKTSDTVHYREKVMNLNHPSNEKCSENELNDLAPSDTWAFFMLKKIIYEPCAPGKARHWARHFSPSQCVWVIPFQ